jgi:hypothetical protein
MDTFLLVKQKVVVHQAIKKIPNFLQEISVQHQLHSMKEVKKHHSRELIAL